MSEYRVEAYKDAPHWFKVMIEGRKAVGEIIDKPSAEFWAEILNNETAQLRQQLAERDVRIAELEAFATKMAIELTAFVITNQMGKVIGISFDRALSFQKEATKVLEKSLIPASASAPESRGAPFKVGDKVKFIEGDFAKDLIRVTEVLEDKGYGVAYFLFNETLNRPMWKSAYHNELEPYLTSEDTEQPTPETPESGVTLSTEEINWLAKCYEQDFKAYSFSQEIKNAPKCVMRYSEDDFGYVHFRLEYKFDTAANRAAIAARRKELGLGE